MIRALLLSSSRAGDTDYLEHAIPFISRTLGDQINEVLFVPYAGVSLSYDEYTEKVQQAFEPLNITVTGIHTTENPAQAVRDAQAIVVGGGNTFHLLHELYRYGLVNTIAQVAHTGTPYIGWSAGSNVAGFSIRTTNDMPIIQPPSFDAIKLLPVQLNPHYIDYQPPGFNGETRQMRIEEFMAVNPQMSVIGIQEGSALYIEGEDMTLWGEKEAYLFISGEKRTYPPQSNLGFLLR
jgi:dipeptidase E